MRRKKEKIRVLMVTGSFPPLKCGVGDYTYQLAHALAETQLVEMNVITSKSADEHLLASNLNVIYSMEWRLRETFKFIKTLFKIKPDIVHVQYPTQGYGIKQLPSLISLISYLLGFKVVQTWHEIMTESRRKIWPQLLTPGGLVLVRPNYIERLNPNLRWSLSLKKIAFIRNGSNIPHSMMTLADKTKLREDILKGKERILFFFGFINPNKGVDLLFEIANPETDHVIIAGSLENNEYHQKIRDLAANSKWRKNCTLTGYIGEKEIADYLAVADAAVFPFIDGGGEWNSTIHAAKVNGTFVVTTSLVDSGLKDGIYYARPSDIDALKKGLALSDFSMRSKLVIDSSGGEWSQIAAEHMKLYRGLLNPTKLSL